MLTEYSFQPFDKAFQETWISPSIKCVDNEPFLKGNLRSHYLLIFERIATTELHARGILA